MKPISSRIEKAERPTGIEVVRWPEFLALAKRLGIDLDLPSQKITIYLPHNDLAKITQEYLADDLNQPNAKTPFDHD